MEKIKILGIDIFNVTRIEALEYVSDRIRKGERTKVYTPNSEMLVEGIRDRGFEEILVQGDLLLPDGVGLIKVAPFYKKRFKEKVAGVDFTQDLIERGASEGWKIFIFGGTKDSVESAFLNLERKYPGLVVGHRDGYFSEEEEPNLVREIKDSGATILIVGLGMKKQERFIHERMEETGALAALGVGGTIDIIAGTVNRAPDLFIKLGLEWMYRLLKQPKRFIRMLDLPRFVFLSFADSLYNKGE